MLHTQQLVRPMLTLYECSYMCACRAGCRNRVVADGPKIRLQVCIANVTIVHTIYKHAGLLQYKSQTLSTRNVHY
jgi:hypothetical protein